MNFYTDVWPELIRVEGVKIDDWEAYGIEFRKHGLDFDTWPPTEEEAQRWYERVWFDLGIQELPEEMRVDAFLFAINTSLVRRKKTNARITSPLLTQMLQCGLFAIHFYVDIDGVMGPQTIRAMLRNADKRGFAAAVRGAMLSYYRGLMEFPRYKNSWLRRLMAVEQG